MCSITSVLSLADSSLDVDPTRRIPPSQFRLTSHGKQGRPSHPPQGPPFNPYGGRDYDESVHDDDADWTRKLMFNPSWVLLISRLPRVGEEPPIPLPRKKQATAPARRPPSGDQSRNPGDCLEEKLLNLSPEKQRYFMNFLQRGNGGSMPLPVRSETNKEDRVSMGSMRLDEWSRPPAGRRGPRAGQNPPRAARGASDYYTHRVSEAQSDRQRRKDIDGVDNPHIDAIMEMIGLEPVKQQVLKIMDKVDVTVRQGTSLAKERFNIVLLGNPGTGIVYLIIRREVLTDRTSQERPLLRGTMRNS